MNKIKAIIFDWGDTVMCDFPEYTGPMAYWPKVEVVPGIEKALQQLQKTLSVAWHPMPLILMPD